VQELKAQAADMTPTMLAPAACHGHFHYAGKRLQRRRHLFAARTRPRDDRHRRARVRRRGALRARRLRAAVVDFGLPAVPLQREHRQQSKFRFLDVFYPHLAALRKEGREIIVCGDWNIAHKEIDLKNWRSNQKNSGFLPRSARG